MFDFLITIINTIDCQNEVSVQFLIKLGKLICLWFVIKGCNWLAQCFFFFSQNKQHITITWAFNKVLTLFNWGLCLLTFITLIAKNKKKVQLRGLRILLTQSMEKTHGNSSVSLISNPFLCTHPHTLMLINSFLCL